MIAAGSAVTAAAGPAPTLRPRSLTSTAIWSTAGIAWTAQNFLPWTRDGLLAHTTPVEAAGLLRTGLLGDTYAALAAVVLVLPLAGLALVVLSLRPHARSRTVVWAAGAVVCTSAVWALTDLSVSRLGPGAWCAVLGCLVPLVALAHQRRSAASPGVTP